MEMIRLGELVRIEKGKKVDRLSLKRKRHSLRYLQIEDLRPNSNLKFCDNFKCPIATENDVVIAWDGANAGIVASGLSGLIGSTLAVLKPDISRMVGSFLSRYLESQLHYIQQNRTGATVPHVDRDILEDILVPVPQIHEQQKVVRLLDQVDRLRRLRCYALEMSGSFLSEVFIEIFGDLNETAAKYEQLAFGDTVDSNQLGLVRGASGMSNSCPYEYLRMDSIVGDGTLDLNKLKRVKASDAEVRLFNLQYGDFLFNTRNSKELVGKTALYTQRHGVRLFNNNIMRVRFKSMVTPEFMIGLFQSSWLKQNLERIKSGTTSVFAIYYKDLADIPVIVPSLSLQMKFVEIVERHERLHSSQVESLRHAEHLFQTLLHRAFKN